MTPLVTDTLQIGDTILDNDPRMAGRVLRITDIRDGYVTAAGANGRSTNLEEWRVHHDGKSRRSGWSLVARDGQP